MPGPNYFRYPIETQAKGGTFDEVTFGPIRNGRFYRITRFAVEDETSSPSGDIRVYVSGHGLPYWLLEQNSPQSATLYWDDRGTFLVEGESLVARFTGATAGDRLRMYIEGWYLEPDNPAHARREAEAMLALEEEEL